MSVLRSGALLIVLTSGATPDAWGPNFIAVAFVV